MVPIPLQPDCCLRGELTCIQPLRPADLPEMLAWERYAAPLLQEYNLPFTTPAEGEAWLNARAERRWVYAIRNRAGMLVGQISLRQVELCRSSRLGIAMGAQHTGRGYGRDALVTLLDYYFGELRFAEMRLDVSGPNLRARRLYQTLGFRPMGHFWLDAPAGAAPTGVDRAHLRGSKLRYYEMRLRAREWAGLRASPA